MVQHGKPAPDLFLLAAEKMGYPIQDFIVVEDSVDGIKAGKSADMKVFAFIGAEANNNDAYHNTCIKTGADDVFETMEDLHEALIHEYEKKSLSEKV